jgi:hypothetical protein
VIPFHETTAAAPKGETSVVFVVGLVSQVLGGGGLGVAVRVQHQQTVRSQLGGELAIGRGDADDDTLWLFALRGYGKLTPRNHDWAALHYGAGVSVLSTGMTTLTAHTAGQVGWINDYWEPYVGAGLALAVPIVKGRAFGDMESDDDAADYDPHRILSNSPQPLRTRLYLTFVPGFAVPIGDTGHLLSLDAGMATAITGKNGGFLSLSLADAIR